MLGAQELSGPEYPAGLGGVLRRDIVRMGTIGESGGNRQHFRTQSADDRSRLFDRRRAQVFHSGHGLQIALHRGRGLLERVAEHAFHERAMRHAQTEQKSSGRLLRESVLSVDRRIGVARVDAHDPGREVEPAGVRQEPRTGDQGVARGDLRHPERPVTPRLDAPREGGAVGRTHEVDQRPDAECADIHDSRGQRNSRRHTLFLFVGLAIVEAGLDDA